MRSNIHAVHLARLGLFACLSVLLACGGSVPAPATPSAPASETSSGLRLAATRWPPFTDTAEHPALALELVRNALTRAGYASTTEILPEGALSPALDEGRFDGSPAMWPSPEREALLYYSEPYLENRLVLVGQKGSDVSARTLDSLVGKRVGVVKSYAYGPEVEDAKGPTLVRGDTDQDNLRALMKGELDYVLVDALFVHHVLERHPTQAAQYLQVGKIALSTRTLHLALRKDVPNALAIIEAFNRQLPEMRGDGTYNAALQVQWVRADLDGDGTAELVASGEKLGTEAPRDGYEPLTAPDEAGHAHPEGHVHADSKPRFVVNGVPYDTWDAVPDRFKQLPDALEDKPRTLRVELFQF